MNCCRARDPALVADVPDIPRRIGGEVACPGDRDPPVLRRLREPHHGLAAGAAIRIGEIGKIELSGLPETAAVKACAWAAAGASSNATTMRVRMRCSPRRAP